VFVRSKKVKAGEYYQLVENYRPKGGGIPRQRVLLHLGNHDTVRSALEGWSREIERLRSYRQEADQQEEYLRNELLAPYDHDSGTRSRYEGPMPRPREYPGILILSSYWRSRARANAAERQAQELKKKLARLKGLLADRGGSD
jgi:hypothetical protein